MDNVVPNFQILSCYHFHAYFKKLYVMRENRLDSSYDKIDHAMVCDQPLILVDRGDKFHQFAIQKSHPTYSHRVKIILCLTSYLNKSVYLIADECLQINKSTYDRRNNMYKRWRGMSSFQVYRGRVSKTH